MTNLAKICKKMGQIVLYLEIFNFKTFRAKILRIFELLIWKIDDFINSFRLNLTFIKLSLELIKTPERTVNIFSEPVSISFCTYAVQKVFLSKKIIFCYNFTKVVEGLGRT